MVTLQEGKAIFVKVRLNIYHKGIKTYLEELAKWLVVAWAVRGWDTLSIVIDSTCWAIASSLACSRTGEVGVSHILTSLMAQTTVVHLGRGADCKEKFINISLNAMTFI